MIIAIDTSTAYASLAVKSFDGEVFSLISSGQNTHIESLDDLLRNLLKEANLTKDKLKQIILGSGPGSFTGLRIGYAYVSGLASALKIPVRELSSFLAAAVSSYGQANKVITSAAGRNEIFCAVYNQNNNLIKAPEIISKEELVLEKGDYLIDLSDATYDFNLIARGLLAAETKESNEFSFLSLASLKPDYLRKVAAVKIKDRK